jgi:hypothetical protein
VRAGAGERSRGARAGLGDYSIQGESLHTLQARRPRGLRRRRSHHCVAWRDVGGVRDSERREGGENQRRDFFCTGNSCSLQGQGEKQTGEKKRSLSG